jgi:hypothetical protein
VPTHATAGVKELRKKKEYNEKSLEKSDLR